MSGYPVQRPRRLRRTPGIRGLVRETAISAEHLIYPIFVVPGTGVRRGIPSMPGIFHLSADQAVEEALSAYALGIPGVLLFGLPECKDEQGTEAWNPAGTVQRAVAAMKAAEPGLTVITDVCLCQYTESGHCGRLKDDGPYGGSVDNDGTLELLGKTALSHAVAGADMVAPSDMMDGRVGYIRGVLDTGGFEETGIMAYSAKYASGFYGPFREAADSAPRFGDRRSYQMDPHNSREALREAALDIGEGADIIMVKPALSYLDIIKGFKDGFGVPVAAYSVSGEYSMVKAAAMQGWLDERTVVMESMASIRRAGADMIITYYAKDVARWLQQGR